ncbi:MAG TPA: hypothetical protein PKJ78_18175 [Candidatus Hydrogenedentes bacterium]|nr:hypothetical protein [Candidatus Hydrogenedentota bacterium]
MLFTSHRPRATGHLFILRLVFFVAFLAGLVFVSGGGILEVFEEILDGPVVHGFECGEGQGGLVAHGQEYDGLVIHGAAQLEIKQALVKDADVFAVEAREVHGGHHPGTGPALPDGDLRAREQFEDLPHEGIVHHVLPETGVLEKVEGPFHAVSVAVATGREQFTAVLRDRHRFVAGAEKDEAEQGENARPGAVRCHEAREPAALEQIAQALKAVGTVVYGVVARQQAFPALREKDHHHAHDQTNGRAIDILRVEIVVARIQCEGVPIDEEFRGLAHAFPEDLR